MAARRGVAKAMKVFFPESTVVPQPGGNFVTSRGVINFITPKNKNKLEIKQELEKIYGLRVLKVNTLVSYGKIRRDYTTRRFYQMKNHKKAIVTIDNTAYLEKLVPESEITAAAQKAK